MDTRGDMSQERNDSANEERQLSEETERLAKMGRGEAVEEAAEEGDKSADERPEWLPDNFKTGEDLLNSYKELQRKLSKGSAKEDGEDEKKSTKARIKDNAKEDEEASGADDDDEDAADGEDDGEDDLPDFSSETVSTAISDVRDAYAETGELSDENREKLNKVGFDDVTIDLYLAGVQAKEKALEASVFETAGGEDQYRAAVKWAKENWSDDDIDAYDTALSNPKLVNKVVKGLMAEFREAEPGEGRLTNVNSGGSSGSVFTSKAEFQQELAKAGKDGVARAKVIDKLRRSRKAGSMKG